MVKARSEEREFERSVRLGEANREIIAKSRAWCSHLSIEMESAGLIAEMTGLPVGSHVVSCRHAAGKTGDMNLPWALPHFVSEACPGCPHHTPNGSTTWGEEVIQLAQRAKTEATEQRTRAETRLKELREQLRGTPRSAKASVGVTETQILEWTEALFSDNDAAAADAGRRLHEAARVAPELFAPVAVNALTDGAAVEPFDSRCLPTLAVLAGRRFDLDERLRAVAEGAIRSERQLEPACLLLAELANRTSETPNPALVAQVIALRDHVRPIGGWPTRHPEHPIVDLPPDYSSSTRFLVLAFDRAPASVLAPLRQGLADNAKVRRVNVCGVIRTLFRARPQLGFDLLPDIVTSLERDDDIYNESADAAACRLLAELFRHNPVVVDELLATRLLSGSEELQALYIDIYQNVAAGRWGDDEADGDTSARDRIAVERAFGRCLELLQSDRLGLDALSGVPEVIESVCEDHPDSAISAFSSLLGTLALLHTREQPPSPAPKLVLPWEPEPDANLLALEARSRRMRWNQFRAAIRKCLEELVANRPAETLPVLLSSFERLDSKIAEGFKADTLALIGRAGKNPDHRPSIMHALWKGLMDYDSQRVRCVAIDALGEAFDGSSTPPPGNVVDSLLIHLRDDYCVVHLAAIRVLSDNTEWLDQAQATEAVNRVYGRAQGYKAQDPFQLDAVVRALLALSRCVPQLREACVRAVVSLLPTGQRVVDKQLLDLLTRRIAPTEPAAVLVAVPHARRIANSSRAAFDYHGDQERVEQFGWLHRLRRKAFVQVESDLLAVARQAAVRDPRDACLFASLFGAFGRYEAEAELLGLADASLPAGRANEQFKQAFAVLKAGAERNRATAHR